MKYLLVLLCLVLSFSSFAKEGKCGLKDSVCSVKYVGTYDGDTFYVDVDRFHPIFKKRLGIRLKYVDTPELRGSSVYEKEMAKRAKNFTIKVLSNLKGNKINLYNCTRGKYFRLVCVVDADGVDLGCELLKKGLAVRYEATKDVKYCE